MGYMITNGTNYIHASGTPRLTYNIADATKFSDEKTARDTIGRIPKFLKKYKWKIVSIADVETEVPSYDSFDYEKAVDTVQNFCLMYKQIKNNKLSLLNQLSEVDKKIGDVMHYIENEKFSASDGYLLSKMLKQYRIERRKVKDELELYDICRDMTMDDITDGSLYDKFVAVKSHKEYNPRILTDLFVKKGVLESASPK